MAKATHWNACTAQRENGSFCDEPTIPDAPFPICFRHGAQLYAFLRGRAETADRDTYLDALVDFSDRRFRHVAVRPDGETSGTGRVYYVQVGEHIKIGCTVNLSGRLRDYPPNRRLLATEPGYEVLEGQRHEQFAEHRVMGREWYTPSVPLIAHINELRRAQHAEPVELPAA